MNIQQILLASDIAIILTTIYAAILIIYNKESKILLLLSIAMLIRSTIAMTARLILKGGMGMPDELLHPMVLFAGYPVSIACALCILWLSFMLIGSI